MKLGIFVDTTNLYHTVYRKHNGRLCYEEYYQQIAKCVFGPESDYSDKVIVAVAYGMTIGNIDSFQNCLSYAGFETCFKSPKIIEIHDVKIKRCDWGVGMTISVVEVIEDVDVIVLGSSDPNLLRLVEWIKRRGKDVWIVSSLIPRVLKESATNVVEIPEAWLEAEEEE